MSNYLIRAAIITVAFILSICISSIAIRYGLPLIKDSKGERYPDGIQGAANKWIWLFDIGFWIGFFETLIIFVFVLNKEFAGLALIFGAKEFVRKEKIKDDPTYYLLGTVMNFGISLLIIQITWTCYQFIIYKAAERKTLRDPLNKPHKLYFMRLLQSYS